MITGYEIVLNYLLVIVGIFNETIPECSNLLVLLLTNQLADQRITKGTKSGDQETLDIKHSRTWTTGNKKKRHMVKGMVIPFTYYFCT